MVYKALIIDGYLNARPPTPEESLTFNKMNVDVERLTTSAKDKSIIKSHQGFLKHKESILIHKFKLKHL
jgi:hypothetical protein